MSYFPFKHTFAQNFIWSEFIVSSYIASFLPIGIKVMTRVKSEFACGSKKGIIAYERMIHLDFGVSKKSQVW
jgi:hypothetical protein